MFPRLRWTLLAMVFAVVWYQIEAPAIAAGIRPGQMAYGVGYAVLSALILAAVARVPVTPYPPLWRMIAMLLALGAATVDLTLRGFPRPTFLTFWAAAIIGIGFVSLLARVLPARVMKLWYGREPELPGH